MIEIQRTGSHMTIVDSGRYGYRRYGVPSSGSMDQISAARANSLLSNPLKCALLEMYLSGHQIKFHIDTRIALSGAQADMHINEHRVYSDHVIDVRKDSILSIGSMHRGARIYLAFEGGVDSSILLGSRSSIPGYFQRKLSKGDKLSLLSSEHLTASRANIKALDIQVDTPIACHKGPEWYFLSKDNQLKVQEAKYVITHQSDRMGYRLDGKVIKAKQSEIFSSVVTPGTIQLLPNGLPILLMRDCQTTGGYPRILQIAERDINQLAQRRPGQEVQFTVLA